MGQRFHHEAITLLVTQLPQLTGIEIAVLNLLEKGAEDGCYWDTPARVHSELPDLPIVLQNIRAKAVAWGLVPALRQIKEICNVEEATVESCS